MEGELSPDDAEKYLDWLERDLAGSERDWAVRIHIHRAGTRLQCAFALTKGAGRYKDVTTTSCEEAAELESLFRQYAEKIWSSLFPDSG